MAEPILLMRTFGNPFAISVVVRCLGISWADDNSDNDVATASGLFVVITFESSSDVMGTS